MKTILKTSLLLLTSVALLSACNTGSNDQQQTISNTIEPAQLIMGVNELGSNSDYTLTTAPTISIVSELYDGTSVFTLSGISYGTTSLTFSTDPLKLIPGNNGVYTSKQDVIVSTAGIQVNDFLYQAVQNLWIIQFNISGMDYIICVRPTYDNGIYGFFFNGDTFVYDAEGNTVFTDNRNTYYFNFNDNVFTGNIYFLNCIFSYTMPQFAQLNANNLTISMNSMGISYNAGGPIELVLPSGSSASTGGQTYVISEVSAFLPYLGMNGTLTFDLQDFGKVEVKNMKIQSYY